MCKTNDIKQKQNQKAKIEFALNFLYSDVQHILANNVTHLDCVEHFVITFIRCKTSHRTCNMFKSSLTHIFKVMYIEKL